MSDNLDYYMYVELPEHEPFTLVIRDQVVVEAPILYKWMKGKTWFTVKKWLKRHKAKFKVVTKQYYIK
jgi:hypothetical protein